MTNDKTKKDKKETIKIKTITNETITIKTGILKQDDIKWKKKSLKIRKTNNINEKGKFIKVEKSRGREPDQVNDKKSPKRQRRKSELDVKTELKTELKQNINRINHSKINNIKELINTNKIIMLEATNTAKQFSEGEKVFFIERTCGDKKFSGFSPFFLKRVIDNAAGGEVKTARITRDGKILVHAKNQKQAQKISMLKLIENYNVTVKEDIKFKQTTGVIFCPDLKYSTDDEILEELHEQKAITIKRMFKKQTNGQSYETGLYFITFNTRNIPTELKVGYEVLEVREYIPEPMRCYRCLKFGHSQNYCKLEARMCGTCYKPEHIDKMKKEKCTKNPRCANCGSNEHGSFNKECNMYRMEKEIAAIRIKMKISYGLARKEYCTRNPLNARNFATVARSTTPPNEDINTINNQSTRKKSPIRTETGVSGKLALASKETPVESENLLAAVMETDEDDEITKEILGTTQKRAPTSPLTNGQKKKKKGDKKNEDKK